ncbi:class I SAM-dependent methyltransferase [Streptomyces cucumeris]|uniref:class I SAM-dependent methyltransferase n=1 Tax=Streptomyces cucumeris TaxID=2962890 RepID=UPI003D713949
MSRTYWNHNVHYHPLVLGAVPHGCGAALDIGCGEGLLVRKLAARAASVTGVDRSAEMIRRAREAGPQQPTARVSYLEADFLDAAQDRLTAGGYDFVSAVAAVHHMDFAEALHAMARLLAPGGRLVVIGLAANRTPLDWIVSGACIPAAALSNRRNGGVHNPEGMPVQMPGTSWGQVRREARRLLPGCRFRRHLLWRYSLVWEKP